ncbi:MAG TPA: hypothetical protein ENN09_05080, partial [Planctomycetes bacterium]|nr:hypothetical protein [Planctomycetota bacterium]
MVTDNEVKDASEENDEEKQDAASRRKAGRKKAYRKRRKPADGGESSADAPADETKAPPQPAPSQETSQQSEEPLPDVEPVPEPITADYSPPAEDAPPPPRQENSSRQETRYNNDKGYYRGDRNRGDARGNRDFGAPRQNAVAEHSQRPAASHVDSSRELPLLNVDEIKGVKREKVVEMAVRAGVENAEHMTRQEIVFNMVRRHLRAGGRVRGSGVLEILPDGFGFLRSP